MTIRDVLIIGAGAAGSTAAFHLAQSNYKVTLLEKEEQNKLKPCGGGMASSVQHWFPFDLKPVVEEVIERVEFSWYLDDLVMAELPGNSPFWIVKREKLDEYLANKAIDAGAELIKPFEVSQVTKTAKGWIITDKNYKQLKSRALILANGSNSLWPANFGLGPKSKHLATTTSIRLQGRGNLTKGSSRFEFGLVHHGFAWAFPLNDCVNVGVGTFIGKSSSNNDYILEKLLPNLGFDPKSGSRIHSSLSVWNGNHKINGEGIIAIGDAASLCDPFLAEGLRPALMSGCEAAKALNEWLSGNTSNLDGYSQAMQKRWGKSMAWGKRIAQVFYRFPKVGYQLGIKRPTAPQRIAQILSGEMGYEDIAKRVIKRLMLQRFHKE